MFLLFKWHCSAQGNVMLNLTLPMYNYHVALFFPLKDPSKSNKTVSRNWIFINSFFSTSLFIHVNFLVKAPMVT